MKVTSSFNITSIIRILLVLGLIAWTFFILRPFILVIIWAIILAVALFPFFDLWTKKFPNKKLGVGLFTISIATILFVPIYFLTAEIVLNSKDIVQNLK